MLNIIWVAFFLIAFAVALFKLLVLGDTEIFNQIMQAMFALSKTAFEIALGLTGILALWLGIMKIGERSGFVELLTRGLSPLFTRLMPEVPKNHPALGAMVMNISANALGLDNAATPLGIKAMQELQKLNPLKDTASNAQILFLVINTSAVTLFPVTIFTYRAQMGAANPTDVFIPLLIATYFSTLIGLITVAAVQKINLLDRVVLMYLGGFSALVFGLLAYFSSLEQSQMLVQSAIISNVVIFSLVIAFIVAAAWQRVNAYEAFIEGAKEGFSTAVMIIPYLVAMLVAIGVFRASGALDLIADGIRAGVLALGMDDKFVDALPTALMKPFSGSGARAMMIDTMEVHGADSFAGRLASIVQGSTETTFYVLAVYFGAVGIQKIRHAVACGLAADVAGITAAILVAYWFFG
ncbi:nucleoside recognition domain-containing protein [Methylophaga sp. UBA2689]|jgi:spore maturation protein SpmA|uniref:nucleoside recognition domain-containing protein n=1 Tax=Methylophaga sp. UBA2689 TaxID=1946878 RepID=UPI0025EF5246|nr:spore maturation protein [Methylophaga sp. UBA2689]|tara:strand:- start:2808 stop:4037 length:1230 start_codon:yes stop_codon:yes gene_type:complete